MVPKLFLNIYSIIQVLSRVLLAQITLIEMETEPRLNILQLPKTMKNQYKL
jgi:hypothetical protein